MSSSKMTYLSVLVALQLFVSVSAIHFGCPTLFDFYPHPTNCGRFFRCFWGSAYEFNCPTGTAWSQRQRTCDHLYNVPCFHVGVLESTSTSTYPGYDWNTYDNSLAAANRVVQSQSTTIQTDGGPFAAGNAEYGVGVRDVAVEYTNEGYGYGAGYQNRYAHWPALGYARNGVSQETWSALGKKKK